MRIICVLLIMTIPLLGMTEQELNLCVDKKDTIFIVNSIEVVKDDEYEGDHTIFTVFTFIMLATLSIIISKKSQEK